MAINELLQKVITRARMAGAGEDLDLAYYKMREGLVVWDCGFSPPALALWASCEEELREKLQFVLRGMSIMLRRRGQYWVWRSPRDWGFFLWLGRACEPIREDPIMAAKRSREQLAAIRRGDPIKALIGFVEESLKE